MRKLYFLIVFVIWASVSHAQMAPGATTASATLVQGNTDTISVLAHDINHNPRDSIRLINVWGSSAGQPSLLDSAFVVYYSTEPNFYGLDSFYYNVCDTRIAGLCDTGLIVVNVIRVPQAYDTTYLIGSPRPLYINALLNDSNFNVNSSLCVGTVWGLPAGWDSIAGCGQILLRPRNVSSPVTDTLYYSLCYTQPPVLCDTGMLIIVLSGPVPDFTPYEQDTLCIIDIYNNATLADSVTWTVQFLSGNGQNETLGNVNQFQLSASNPDSAFDVLVCQTAYNALGDSTVCYPLWIQCIVGSDGIKGISTAHIIIYPDPASDRIQISLSGMDPADLLDIPYIRIYDMMGKELKAIPMGEIGTTISVSELSPGMYLITLVDQHENKKLVSRFEVMR